MTEPDRAERPQEGTAQAPITVQLTPSRTTLACITDPQVLHVLIEIEPNSQLVGVRVPLNLCLLVDRSTSMKGARLAQVKAAAHRLIDALDDTDALSVVTFSDRAEVIVPAQRPVNKQEAKARVNTIHASGGTEIFRGLMHGLAELYKQRDPSGPNHLILLTDGRTYGDEDDCLALAAEAAPDGIAISAMGIGNEWNDAFLDRLAGATGGSSLYVENDQQVVKFLDECVRSLDAAFAHDVRLEVRPQPGIQMGSMFKLAPTPQPLTADRDVYHVGTLAERQALELLLELVVQPHPPGRHGLFELNLAAEVRGFSRSTFQTTCHLGLTFSATAPQENPPATLVEALGQLSLYYMHERSIQDVERGQTQLATRRLQALARRLGDLGQTALAQTALAEADRLQKTGSLSEEGRKRLKYGTRALIGTALRGSAP